MESNNVIYSAENKITERYKVVFDLQRHRSNHPDIHKATSKVSKLEKLKAAIKTYEDRLMEALLVDTGKQKFESVFMEVGALSSEIDIKIMYLNEGLKIKYLPATGVTLIVGPSNYPVFLQLSPLILAIAAGNSAILKPSELTPTVSGLLVEMLAEYFDPADISIFEGGKDTLASLLTFPFHHIYFNGCYTLAKMVLTAAAENLCGVDLSLTGRAPVIVGYDSDLEKCAEKVVRDKFLNAGQNTTATDYVFVHESQKNAFVALLMLKVRTYYHENTYTINMDEYAAITSEYNFERLRFLLNDAVKHGAAIVLGGTIDKKEYVFHPTILTDVPYASAVLREEIFGPILPVLTYQDIDEVMGYISGNDRLLSLYPFTGNPDTVFPAKIDNKSFRTV